MKWKIPVMLACLCLAIVACEEADEISNPIDSGTGTDTGTGGDTGTDSGSGHWSDCATPSDCVLVANSCCGVCGAPSLDDVDGINVDKLDDHRSDVCTDPNPMCPGCAEAPNPELIATCASEGKCLAIDLGLEELTRCTTADDCRIRTPACCECGADLNVFALVAIRTDAGAALEALVCDEHAACPECAPVYPADLEAICDTDGHCATSATH